MPRTTTPRTTTTLALSTALVGALGALPAMGASTRPSIQQLERAITVTTGHTKTRSRGNVCPPNVGCATSGYVDGDPQPLTLVAGRQISIALPYKASRVTLQVVRKNQTRGGANLRLHRRNGRWYLTTPDRIQNAQAIAISTFIRQYQVNYSIGVRGPAA